MARAAFHWTTSELNRTIASLLPVDAAFDLAVVRPPHGLVPRERPYFVAHPDYGHQTSLGHEAIAEFPTMVTLVLFTDVAVDYFIREALVPSIAAKMMALFGKPVCYYDGYAILRKEAAVRAGLGRIGRNALFFSRRFGFNCKIDLFLTTVEFDRYDDEPVRPWQLSICAECDVCIAACPVDAYQDFVLHDPEACDALITPKWNEPSLMCRSCITSCPPSNTLLARSYERGAPPQRRMDGIANGSDEGTADELYRRIAKNVPGTPVLDDAGVAREPSTSDADHPLQPLPYFQRR